VAGGGVVGAGLRWGVLEAAPGSAGFLVPLLLLNTVGSLVLGVALARGREAPSPLWWRDAVGIGFCGGLTTFSTFAVEAAELIRDGRPGVAVAYVTASVVVALLAIVGGAAMAGSVGAVDDPLESDP
jgi:CrcB protein